MTEAEWLKATEPTPMLEFVRGNASARKLRLFACGVCRQLACYVTPVQDYISGIDAAEVYADESRRKAEVTRRRKLLKARMVSIVDGTGNPQPDEWNALFLATVAISDKEYRTFPTCIHDLRYGRISESLKAALSGFCLPVRDIFGNPFRPVILDPSWLTTTVLALTTGIYEDRAFDLLPILGDALMDAGCDEPAVLAHCRCDEPHVRGCWLIDLLLGKK